MHTMPRRLCARPPRLLAAAALAAAAAAGVPESACVSEGQLHCPEPPARSLEDDASPPDGAPLASIFLQTRMNMLEPPPNQSMGSNSVAHAMRGPFGLLQDFRKQGSVDTNAAGRKALRRSSRGVGYGCLQPDAWAVLGPLATFQSGSDPLEAFGGLWNVVERSPPQLWEAVRQAGDLHANGNTRDVAEISEVLQDKLEWFPVETGSQGRTSWALGLANRTMPGVTVSSTARDSSLVKGYQGWAVGKFTLSSRAVILVKSTDPFAVDGGEFVRNSDAYGLDKGIHALTLDAGEHMIAVSYKSLPFWTDILLDSADARELVTGVADLSSGRGGLVALDDSKMSDFVDGHVASGHVGLSVLNAAGETLVPQSARVVVGPENMRVKPISTAWQVPILAGQTFLVRLELEQSGSAASSCWAESDTTFYLNLTLRLQLATPAGEMRPAVDISLQPQCVRFWGTQGSPAGAYAGGYKVAFPDFDGSIQQMWVAPPNVSAFTTRACPTVGCPLFLSTHGAAVDVGTNWGRNYAWDDNTKEFPYPAWLVQPSNRNPYGTDWEEQGYDDGLAAMEYVARNLPGVPAGVDRSRIGVDTARRLVTGHSMGGHGCMVYSVHDPDRLLGAACCSGWASIGRSESYLSDPVGQGILQSPMVEHAVDFLAPNLKGVPLGIFYGDSDSTVSPVYPRYQARLVDSTSQDKSAVRLVELEDTSHWFTQNEEHLVEYLTERVVPASGTSEAMPLPPLPEVFEFVVPNPAVWGTKGGLRVLQLEDAAKPGKVVVRRCMAASEGDCAVAAALAGVGPGRGEASAGDLVWLVETTNVRRFRLEASALAGRAAPAAASVDGTLLTGAELLSQDPGGHLCQGTAAEHGMQAAWRACTDRAWESVQRGGRSAGAGPLQMAIRQAPVCIVHGGGSGQAEAALSLAQKLYFVSRYATPILDATSAGEAGPEVARCSSANLILIGDPGTNPWTSTHRCAFSYVSFFRTSAGAPSAAFGLDGKKFASPGTGLVALGALGGGRLGLLVHGTDAQGLAKAIRRVPSSSGMAGADYIVDGPAAGWMGDGGVLAAGYLDALWRPGPTSWAEPDGEAPDALGLVEAGGAAEQCGDRLRLLQRSDEELLGTTSTTSSTDTSTRSGGARAAPTGFVLLSVLATWAGAA